MSKTACLLALFAAPAALADNTAGAASAGALAFREHGFSIKAPVGHNDKAMQQVVTLMLPAEGGFSPNVNVQVQPYPGSIEDYIKLSKGQFQTAGVTIVTEKHDAKQVTLEYTGKLQGVSLHWYARGIVGKGKVVLATATAGESQWAAVGATLRQSVDSLALLP